MITTVFFIVTAYGSIIDWAGPVDTMERCLETTRHVQVYIQRETKDTGVLFNRATGADIPVEDITLGCYNVTKEPVIGEPAP